MFFGKSIPWFTFDAYDLFVVNDVVMNAADLGNLNFGYVTSALGVRTSIQLVGAGAAHIMDHGLYDLENLRHFGDSPRCRSFTDMGRRWYNEGRYGGVENE